MTDTATLTAFMFTDVEGSSLKWLNRRAAMQGALAEHDRILRAAIAAHEGEVFKTAGDAFFAAFKRPSDAANAAIAAQKALAAQDWSAVDGLKVRMAVHCGTAEKRDGDWFGPALNRCARLLVLGHGGQLLITAATAELLASEREVKDPSRLIGTHPLDDPAQPVAIHQVLIAGLPQDFPPLRAPETRPTNLPRHLTPLIGREKELQTVKDLVAANRLVTLTGPGGVGKTRLAIEAGLELLPHFANGVWLVELAPLSDAQLVVSAVGAGLRLDLSGNRPPRDILIGHLENQDRLIVLDNCEHVVDAVAELVEALLAGAPRVRILASSQELIGLPGEQVLRIPSLAVPDNAVPSADEALKASAVQMLVERVRSADPKFLFDDKAASVATNICRRLDGVPLALEMAAARVPALGLSAVAQGLDDRFRLLTGGKRTALPRQRTLHSALDWSHALLSEKDRTVFRRLGQFAGGFTLKAATAVAGDALQDHDVVDCLADLVAKSLVVADVTPTGARYRLLETMRAYALEKLGESGEGEPVALRHARHYRDLMGHCVEDLGQLPTDAWRSIYVNELDNVRTALGWSFGPSGEAESGIALAANSQLLFDASNLFVEVRKWLSLAKAKLSETTPAALRARLHAAMATALSHGGYNPSDQAVEALQHAAALCCAPPERAWRGILLAHLGLLRANRGEASRLEQLLTEERSKFEQTAGGPAWQHLLTGMLKFIQGDPSQGRRSFQAAVKLASDAGVLGLRDFAEMSLGVYLVRAGDYAEAAQLLRSLRDRLRQSSFVDMRRLLGATGFLSRALAEIGEHAQALAEMREAVSIARRIGTVGVFCDSFVAVTALAGRYEDAARLAGWADAIHKGFGKFGVVPRPQRVRVSLILQGALPEAELDRLLAEGAQLTEDEACRIAASE